jgi:hypothetical protein
MVLIRESDGEWLGCIEVLPGDFTFEAISEDEAKSIALSWGLSDPNKRGRNLKKVRSEITDRGGDILAFLHYKFLRFGDG